MIKNILSSLTFAIILPTIANIVSTQASKNQIKKLYLNKAYLTKATIILLLSMIISILLDLF